MLPRQMMLRLRVAIAQAPAVALLGARQAGKTTLAKIIAQDAESIYLDLERIISLPGFMERLQRD